MPANPEDPPTGEPRPKKRRRRAVACFPCRTRKLKCDREYPTCGRCLKGKNPSECSYDDGFLWQQPSTVDASGLTHRFPSRPSDVDSLVQGDTSDRDERQRGARSSTSPSPPTPPAPLAVMSPRFAAQGLPRRPSTNLTAVANHPFLGTVMGSPLSNAPRQCFEARPPNAPGVSLGGKYREPIYNQSDWHPLTSPSQSIGLSNKVIIRGKECRTRFNGGGIVANLMTEFPEIKTFVTELKANHLVRNLHDDVESLKRGFHRLKSKDVIDVPDTAKLLELLPRRAAANELLSLYTTYIESTVRILHLPSLYKTFENIWLQKEEPHSLVAIQVVQLLLVFASVAHLYDGDRLGMPVQGSTPKPLPVLDWIRYCGKWIDGNPFKRPGVDSLRTQCLLVIAKNNQGLGRSSAWTITGAMVRQAILAGYHRDPKEICRISPFNQEMRRRIWATIVELDVQVALDRGMPPNVHPEDYDTDSPLNINDVEINEDTVDLPRSRPMDEITDCSFQVLSLQSLPLRLKICSVMNAPRITCSYDEMQRYEWEVALLRNQMPKWARDELDNPNISHKTLLGQSMLDSRFSQILLAIHTPPAMKAHEEPMFVPSTRTRLEVATSVLARHHRLHEISPRLALCHFSDLVIQACLSISHHMYMSESGFTCSLVRRMVPSITDALLELIEKTMTWMERRLLIVTKGAKQHFFTSIILALVKARLWPDQAELLKQKLIEHISILAAAMLKRHQTLTAGSRSYPGDDDSDNNLNINLNINDNSAVMKVSGVISGDNPINQNLTPDAFPTPINSNFEGSLPRMGITPPDDINAFFANLDWEDFNTFPLASFY